MAKSDVVRARPIAQFVAAILAIVFLIAVIGHSTGRFLTDVEQMSWVASLYFWLFAAYLTYLSVLSIRAKEFPASTAVLPVSVTRIGGFRAGIVIVLMISAATLNTMVPVMWMRNMGLLKELELSQHSDKAKNEQKLKESCLKKRSRDPEWSDDVCDRFFGRNEFERDAR